MSNLNGTKLHESIVRLGQTSRRGSRSSNAPASETTLPLPSKQQRRLPASVKQRRTSVLSLTGKPGSDCRGELYTSASRSQSNQKTRKRNKEHRQCHGEGAASARKQRRQRSGTAIKSPTDAMPPKARVHRCTLLAAATGDDGEEIKIPYPTRERSERGKSPKT